MSDDDFGAIAGFVGWMVLVAAVVAVVVIVGTVVLLAAAVWLAGCWTLDQIHATAWWQKRQFRQAMAKGAADVKAAEDAAKAAMHSETDEALAKLRDLVRKARVQLAVRQNSPAK